MFKIYFYQLITSNKIHLSYDKILMFTFFLKEVTLHNVPNVLISLPVFWRKMSGKKEKKERCFNK